MKILVLSDSHNDILSIEKAIEAENDADVIFHAGDYAKDIRFADTRGKMLYVVKGNCDGVMASDSDEEMITLEGIRFFLSHGHKYGVKSGIGAITSAAKLKKADVVVFGHTHIPLCINSEGILLINPGSISAVKSERQSYAVIITDGKGDIIKTEIRYL